MIPASLPFVKMHGVGNDFVVVDGRDAPPDTDYSALTIALADRRFGIGSDGLMVLSPSQIADIRARMFNPDGTEDFCGNGTRCLARFAFERGDISTHATIETKAGIRSIHIGQTEVGSFREATLSMGRALFGAAEIPLLTTKIPARDIPLVLDGETVRVSVVSTGTPHAVLWMDASPDDATFLRLSPQIENYPIFPERTSVLWTMVSAPDALTFRIWERGAGETLGCGSGACAAATLARLEGKITPTGAVSVHSRGGTLRVGWRNDDSNDEIFLTGPAERVYSGVWSGGSERWRESS